MVKNKISVIVPIYNVEPYIHECIDSIINQTYPHLEIILVDDESPDNCPAICDTYAAMDSRIKVIHKKNGGLSDARNAGLDIATGEYIGFVDSDDWIEKDMFEYLLNGILKYNADIAVCNLFYATQYRYTVKNICPDKVLTSYEALEAMFNDQIECYAWNKLFKRSVWGEVRYPLGKNFEDMLTIYKPIDQAQNIVFLEEAKYYYRQRSDSISGTRDYKNRKHIYQAVCDRYEDVISKYPEFAPALVRRITMYYAYELSCNVVMYPKEHYLNLKLLNILSSFIMRNKMTLLNNKQWNFFERKTMELLSSGTVRGCTRILYYHKLEKVINKVKGRG